MKTKLNKHNRVYENDVKLLKKRKEEWGENKSGIILRLQAYFDNNDTQAYLCSPSTDHIPTEIADLGWGCGYRNCQMLMTFLERQQEQGEYVLKQVPDIAGLQLLLEQAWSEGFDAMGADQLKHHVFKTRKWIGTSEVYTLLTYLGIRCTIIDFHQPGHRHQQLLDWIEFYFKSSAKNIPPLYLQHQGHSRTVVGIELLKNGRRNLIMFDPSRRMLRSYRSDAANAFRVDDRSIAKNKQYQVLVLGEVVIQPMQYQQEKGFLLTAEEREARKIMTTWVI